jgi:hypothetical protein
MRKFSFILIVLIILPVLSFAQAEMESAAEYSTNGATLLGFGRYNVRDTYLSPSTDINYTGWEFRVMNERLKLTRLADYRVARQQVFDVEFGSTENGAHTARELVGFIDYSLAYMYKFDNLLLSSLDGFAGLSAKGRGGFIYNTRNSNNPASGKADVDINLSAMLVYNFKIKQYPIALRYQTEIPLLGALFSIHKGQPYYYLTEGDGGDLIKFSSFHNKFAMKNYISVDLPAGFVTFRVGYLGGIYRTNVNDIKTHVISNSFMLGLVKEFIAFKGNDMKNRKLFKSAFY